MADKFAITLINVDYADVRAIGIRHSSMESTEITLTNDLSTFRRWRLLSSSTMIVVTCFHLHNKIANRELQMRLESSLLIYNKYPKYLGVILDRTLSIKKHLTNRSKVQYSKLRQTNTVQFLLGINTFHFERFNSQFGVLRSPILCFHTNKVDTKPCASSLVQ